MNRQKTFIITLLSILIILSAVFDIYYFTHMGRDMGMAKTMDTVKTSIVGLKTTIAPQSEASSFTDTMVTTGLPIVDPKQSFTVVVLPDIQNYSTKYPEILCKQTEWILANQKKLNIVFVSQLGDIVNDGASKMEEWQNASKCLGKLSDPGKSDVVSKIDGVENTVLAIPYSVIPGNHDADVPGDKSSGFSVYNEIFPVTRFNVNKWYGGGFEGNRNNYELVTAVGRKMLFMNLGIEPSDEAIAWANGIIKAHTDTYIIVTTHKYLTVGATSPENVLAFSGHISSSTDNTGQGNTGQGVWDKLIFNNCSIAMVWSGHFHGENQITGINSCGQNVKEILQDYQDMKNGGNGWLRIYEFTPLKNGGMDVKMFRYSPNTQSID